MTADNHMNIGGLVLCKRKQCDKSYVFRWRRKDVVYTSDRIQKSLRWIKENILFIEQWNPVDREDLFDK